MKDFRLLKLMLCLILLLFIFNTEARPDSTTLPGIGGHIGIVQPIASWKKNKITTINEQEFYSIGFPIGITIKNSSSPWAIDFEWVAFIKPSINDTKSPYKLTSLWHLGILYSAGGGFTIGLRAAFELETDQFGFTPLINKGIKINQSMNWFFEIVLPARWGPEKKDSFTQILAIHTGISF